MRVIAGEWRGRKLQAPPGAATRPTSDRLRGAIFNLLVHHDWVELPGSRVLDLFAGSGALAIEALSRGAEFAGLIEQDSAARRTIAANLRHLGIPPARARLVGHDATRLSRQALGYDLVFIDPPYRTGLGGKALAAARNAGWITPQSLVVLEHARGDEQDRISGFALLDQRDYGDSGISILRPQPD